MFQDLDATLQNILDDASAPADLFSADVSFITPDKNLVILKPTINLFLFDVKENREQRDQEPVVELDGSGGYTRSRPPIRVDCTYLVTAWSTKQDALKIKDEHMLLALALAWLSRYPNIPSTKLIGSMTLQPLPLPMRVAQTDEKINIGEFWNALGIAPRADFMVTVTISMKLDVSTPEGKPVVTKHTRIHKLPAPETLGTLLVEQFEIAGTVSSQATHLPIPNAEVTLVERGWKFNTAADGRFTFTILEAGNFHLKAVAIGFSQAVPLPITVPGTVLNSYDIHMTP